MNLVASYPIGLDKIDTGQPPVQQTRSGRVAYLVAKREYGRSASSSNEIHILRMLDLVGRSSGRALTDLSLASAQRLGHRVEEFEMDAPRLRQVHPRISARVHLPARNVNLRRTSGCAVVLARLVGRRCQFLNLLYIGAVHGTHCKAPRTGNTRTGGRERGFTEVSRHWDCGVRPVRKMPAVGGEYP